MSRGVTRRAFLASGAAAAAVGGAVDTGGLASVSEPGIPGRAVPVCPPGTGGLKAFRAKCVACQLCVKVCPEKVLRPSRDPKRFLLPEAGFEHGYCRPACTRCAEACPTGAIPLLSREERLRVSSGCAVWHAERCIAAIEGVTCTACERHCPVKAIALVKGVPVLDVSKCIGCGACENLCPSRPLPAMTVEGIAADAEIVRSGEARPGRSGRNVAEGHVRGADGVARYGGTGETMRPAPIGTV